MATRGPAPTKPAMPRLSPTSMKQILIPGVAIVLLSLSVAACGSSTKSGAKSGTNSGSTFTVQAPASVKSAGVLSICADITYPPYTFEVNNTPTGFDVDMANKLAAAMGVQAQFHQVDFPDIVGALEAGKCDAIINGMVYEPSRGNGVIQIPYLQAGDTFAVRASDKNLLTSLEALGGHSVATEVSGLSGELNLLSKQIVAKGGKPITPVLLSSNPAAFEDLLTGKVDAFYQGIPVLAYYAKQNPNQIAFSKSVYFPDPNVMAVRSNDSALANALQAGIKKMYQLGIMQGIATTWDLNDLLLTTQELNEVIQPNLQNNTGSFVPKK